MPHALPSTNTSASHIACAFMQLLLHHPGHKVDMFEETLQSILDTCATAGLIPGTRCRMVANLPNRGIVCTLDEPRNPGKETRIEFKATPVEVTL